ncbi:MAG: hypothetical protein JWP98_785 [Edaphobacter sp.]|nr:hypothetical protein [Edaphobacter sp.]
MFLFDLRTEMHISFGSRGLTGKKGAGLRGRGQQLASTAKGTMVEAQASSQVHYSL